jgi:hypothetical protein
MRFDDLDRTTRRHMRAEFYLDLTQRRLHLPERLSASGRIMFPVALEAAIERGDDATLAETLRENEFVREWEEGHTRAGKAISKHVPWNAADTIAEDMFNRFYMRAICRRALEEQVIVLEVYRAKPAEKPRAESESRIGTTIEPRRLLEDLRAHPGARPDLRLPAGPNSGLSVRFPRAGPSISGAASTETVHGAVPMDMPEEPPTAA